jgi:hypothetical protein
MLKTGKPTYTPSPMAYNMGKRRKKRLERAAYFKIITKNEVRSSDASVDVNLVNQNCF